MTKELAVYADTLNLLGSDVLDPSPTGPDWELTDVLGRLRRRAVRLTGPHASCPHCRWATPCAGPGDGEHFADLWEHLIVHHGVDIRYADEPARKAWNRALAEYEGAKAA
jgi:hypothetical protein